jgi:hypothetical protein
MQLRRLRTLTCVFLLVGALAPVQAQRLDLGNMLRNALNPATYRCKTLLEWVRTPVPEQEIAPDGRAEAPLRRGVAPVAGGLDRRTLYLVSDEVFSKHFSKTYEQLTDQDLREFQQNTARTCTQAGDFRPDEWQTVQRLWNPYQHGQFVRLIQARRAEQAAADRRRAEAKAELDRAMADLEAADLGSLSVDRVIAVRERAQQLAPQLGAEGQQAFNVRYQAWAAGNGAELVRRRIQALLSSNADPETALVQAQGAADLATRGSRLGVSLPEDDPALVALKQHQRALAATLAAADRREMDGWPDGLAGLEAGVQWQRRFEARRSMLARPVPELDEAMNDFTQRRQQVMGRSAGLLTAAVDQTTTIAQAQGLKARYLLPSEAGSSAARSVDEAIDRRVRLIERNEALGRPVLAGSSNAAPNQPSPVKPAAAAAIVSTSPGEPAEEVMYELVRQKFETAAAKVKATYDQCAGGGDRSNGMNMMMCGVLNLQRGVTSGAAAEPTKIVRFSKIGCEKSPSRPGYNCEYEIETSSPIRNMSSKMLGFELDENGFGQARFVRNREGLWLMITSN